MKINEKLECYYNRPHPRIYNVPILMSYISDDTMLFFEKVGKTRKITIDRKKLINGGSKQ